LLSRQQLLMSARQRPGEMGRNVTERVAGIRIAPAASRPICIASRPSASRRAARRRSSAALRFQLSSMPAVAAVYPHAPAGAGEDPDLHPLTQCANPERGNRLEADGAARRARHVQATPSHILVRIGRADVRRLRRLERIDEQAGELFGRLAIEQHGDGSHGQHETTSRRHDSQMAVRDPGSVFLVASSDRQFGPTFRHRYLSSALPHCHRIDVSNRADKL
jgi:hypothetical protein